MNDTQIAWDFIYKVEQTVKTKGMYKSLFTKEYERLPDDIKEVAIGIFLVEYGLSFKDLIDICIEESNQPFAHIEDNEPLHFMDDITEALKEVEEMQQGISPKKDWQASMAKLRSYQ